VPDRFASETGDVVRRSSFVPLYYQLVAILEERIASGQLRPGDRLASESELCAEFGVSRSAVRPALAILENEGRIVRVKGSGCFVAEPKISLEIRGLIRRLSQDHDPDLTLSVLAARPIRGGGEVSAALRLSRGQQVVHITSVGSFKDRPLFVCDSYVSSPAVPGAASVRVGSPIPISIANAHINWSEPSVVIESSFCTPFEAERLQVAPGSPMLMVRCIESSIAGLGETESRPVEIAWLMCRADSVRLSWGANTLSDAGR
jgi:DNA-binding GntR family transcriptional regulator